MGCNECGLVFSLVFGIQYHKVDCTVGLADDRSMGERSRDARLARAAAILDETGAHDAARQVRAIRA